MTAVMRLADAVRPVAMYGQPVISPSLMGGGGGGKRGNGKGKKRETYMRGS